MTAALQPPSLQHVQDLQLPARPARSITFDLVAVLREAAAMARQHGVEVRVAASGAVVIKPVAVGENGQPIDKRAERNRRYYEAQRVKAKDTSHAKKNEPSASSGAAADPHSVQAFHASSAQESTVQEGNEQHAQTSQRLDRLERLNRLKTSESVLNRLNGGAEKAAPLPLSPSLPLSPQTPLSPAHPHTPTPGHKRAGVREEAQETDSHEPQTAETSSSTAKPPANAEANATDDLIAKAGADTKAAGHRSALGTSSPPTPQTQPRPPAATLKGWVPDAAQQVVNGWFSRRVTTPWSAKEQKAWKAIPAEAKAEGLEALAPAYTATQGEAFRYRRRDLLTLLNHWQGEIDRWRHFKAPVQSDVRPLQTGYEDPPFLTDDAAIFHSADRAAAAAARVAAAATASAPGAAMTPHASLTIQR